MQVPLRKHEVAACSSFHLAKERRMIEDLQIRNLSVCTQESYIRQVSLFARHFNKSLELLGPEQIRTYQLYLMNEKKLAPISTMVAISALRFLYGVTLKKDWSGDPAEIKAKRVKKQKNDRNDAGLLLRLMRENNFPQIWVPSPENRDLRFLMDSCSGRNSFLAR
jgi:integrase-like protein